MVNMNKISIFMVSLLILVIILIVFGVGKLPEIGSGVGKAIKEFRNSVGTDKKDDEAKK